MKIAYQAIFKTDEKGVVVSFPDLQEAFTEGASFEEALHNAVEVLDLTLEGRIDEGLIIPEPNEHENGEWVYPSAQVQAAVLVRLERKNLSLSDLARALGTSWPSAQRLENPKHSPTLKQLERAAAVLGKRLVLSFETIEERKRSAA